MVCSMSIPSAPSKLPVAIVFLLRYDPTVFNAGVTVVLACIAYVLSKDPRKDDSNRFHALSRLLLVVVASAVAEIDVNCNRSGADGFGLRGALALSGLR